MRYSLKVLRSLINYSLSRATINYSLAYDRSIIRFTKGSTVGIFPNVFMTADNFNYRSSDEGVMLLS